MKKKYLPLLLVTTLLTSCEQPTNIRHTVPGYFIGDNYYFPMDTIVTLTSYYQSQYDKYVNEFDNIVITLGKEMDRYHDFEGMNNLKTVNDSCGTGSFVKVSDDLYEMLKLAAELTELTEGKFNFAMGNLIDLYSEKLDDSIASYNTLPEKSLTDEALASVPSYTDIDQVLEFNEEDKSVKLNKYNGYNVVISLGAIAKGFIMQKTYDLLNEDKNCFLIDAGSSTMATIGKNKGKTDGKYTIGLRLPLLSTDVEVLNTFSFDGNVLISTSADYDNNFFYTDESGSQKLMHHIIDSEKGVSNNYVRSVSVFSDNCNLGVLDALTTALFNVETQTERKALINKIKTYYSVNIDYVITSPYNGSFDEFEVTMSEGISNKKTGTFSEKVKAIYTE